MRDLWEKGKLLWARFSEVSVGTYASSISYFAFLSNAVIVVILPDDVDDFLEPAAGIRTSLLRIPALLDKGADES